MNGLVRIKYFLLLMLFAVGTREVFPMGYTSRLSIDIRSLHAIGDGKMNCAGILQKAIDSLCQEGGGIVIIPKGTFLSGSIILRSDIELHLNNGAVLLGSANPKDYKKNSDHLALILSENSKNISITGAGIIDGQGLLLALTIDSLHHTKETIDSNYNYYRMRPSESVRPQIINFVECSNVSVTNVTIKNGAGWVTTYKQCYNLLIDSVTVQSTAYWNNDGMDICDCKNVRITNCFVNSADDGICLKSYSHEFYNDSIYIAHCTIRSSASAIKFGTDSRGGFTNITIKNIKVYDTYRSAIAIECVDGGVVENINISDVDAQNTGNAIFIRLGHRNTTGEVGSIKNVSIKNIKARIPFGRPDISYDLRGPDLAIIHNPFPASITGIPGHNVENVTLENIEVVYPGRATKGMAYVPTTRLNMVPEKENEYPEFSMFGELPSWGMYVRHVMGISMKRITFRLEQRDFRPPVVFDDVRSIVFLDSHMPAKDGVQQIVLCDVHDGVFKNIHFNLKEKYSLEMFGNCTNILNN